MSATELKKALSDPKEDAKHFALFSKLLSEKYPELSREELRKRWVDLKTDAGLTDG